MFSLISPDVIYIQKFHQKFGEDFKNTKLYNQRPNYYDELMADRAFYDSTATKDSRGRDRDMINYMMRDEACDKISLNYMQDVKDLAEEGKKFPDIVAYMGKRTGSTGLFNEEGDISKEGVKNLRKELAAYDKTIYEAVLSFSNEFGEKYVNNKLAAYKLLCEAFPKYFTNKGLNSSDFKWFAAFHKNTDNYHCHIIFYEKPGTENIREKKNNELWFTQNDFDKMKEIIMFNKPITHEYEKAREPLIEQLKIEMKAGKLPWWYSRLEPIREICKEKTRFADCSRDQQGKLRGYKDFVYNNSPDFKELYDEAIKKIDKAQKQIIDLFEKNGLKPSKAALEFGENRKKELDWRLCNNIIKNVRETITEDEKTKKSIESLWKKDMLLNGELTNKSKKRANSKLEVIRSENAMRDIKTFMKQNDKNEERLKEYKTSSLSLWTKIHIVSIFEAFKDTSSRALGRSAWNEIEQDRRRMLLKLKATKSLNEEELEKEEEKIKDDFERL